MQRIASFMNSLFQVRRGEWGRVLFYGGYVGVAIATVIVLKSLNDAIFLGTYDSSLLPYAFMAGAIFMAGASAAYSSLMDRVSPTLFRRLTLFAFMLLLLGCVLLGKLHLRGFVFAQYVLIWVIAGLMASLGWHFVLSGFDTREGKRLTPLLGAMATVGAIGGGIATHIISHHFGVSWLLLLCVGLLGVLIVLSFKRIDRVEPHELPLDETKVGLWEGVGKGFGLICRNKLMWWTTAALVLSTLAGTFIGYQFKSNLKLRFDMDQIGAFLGTFQFFLNMFVLFIQLFAASRLMNRFGLRGAVVSRPAILVLTSFACLAHPTFFWSFVTMGFVDKLVTPSWYRAGIALSFGPIPAQRAARIRLTHDGVIAPLSRLVACGILIALTPFMPFQRVSWVVFGLAVVWLLAAWGIKPHYIRELGKSIQNHCLTLNTEIALVDAVDHDLLSELATDLTAGDTEEIRFALLVIRETRADELFPAVEALLDHPDHTIQTSAMDTLVALDKAKAAAVLRRRLKKKDDPELTAHLLHCLTQAEDVEAVPVAQGMLGEDSPRLKAAAAVLLFRLGGLNGVVAAVTELSSLVNGTEEERLAACKIIEGIGLDGFDDALVTLLDDRSVGVRMAALDAACHVHSEKVIRRVVQFLDDEELGEHAEQALIAAGPVAIAFLKKLLSGRLPSPQLAGSIARVFRSHPDVSCARELQSWLEADSSHIRHHAVEAFLHLREAGSVPEPAALDHFLQRELRTAYELTVLLEQHEGAVRKELEHNYRQCLIRVFLALGILYDADEMYNVRTAVLSNDSRSKANAVEYLDTTVAGSLPRLVIALLEEISPAEKYAHARGLLGMGPIDAVSLDGVVKTDKWLGVLTGMREPSELDAGKIGLACALADCPLFDGLPLETLYTIAREGETKVYASGEFLFRQGDPARSYLVVLKGSVEIYIGKRLADTVHAGAGFGEVGILSGGVRSASAQSRDMTECFVLSKHQFEHLVRTSPEFAQAVTAFVARMVRAASERQLQLRQRPEGISVV